MKLIVVAISRQRCALDKLNSPLIYYFRLFFSLVFLFFVVLLAIVREKQVLKRRG